MGGGGGGDVNVGSPYGGGGGNRIPSKEKPTIGNWYGFQQDQFNNFIANNPLFNAANTAALSYNQGLPAMLAQFPGFQNELSNYQGQLGGFQNELGGYKDQLQSIFGQLGNFSGSLGTLGNRVGALATPFSKFLGPGSALNEAYGETISPMLRSGGALTPQASRDVSQATRAIQAAQGTAHGTGALGTELLNREASQQQRFNQALAQSQGVLGQQSGATGVLQNILGQQAGIYGQRAGIAGQQAGITGQQAGITGQQGALTQMGAGLTGQKAGLLGQQQALQTGGLNQLVSTGGAGVSAFGGLTNPILGYLGNLFSGNQQAQVQGAQIQAQQNAAGSAKAGGAASGIGSVIGAVLPLLAAFSDERTKTKLKATGISTSTGVPLQTFEYKTNPGVRFLGATAQDIEKKMPSAVFTDPRSGLKMIDTTQFPIVQISAVQPTKKAA